MLGRKEIEPCLGALAWWIVAVMGCVVSGCGSDPEVGDGCLHDLNCELPPGWRCQGDSIPVIATEGRGVFVSASLGEDGMPGTKDQPVRTFREALLLAEKGPRRVYACAEEFTEAVAVSSDVEIWGGFSCEDGWRDVHGGRATVLRAEPDSIPLQVNSRVHIDALFADLRLEAADATRPGGSSIAMLVANDLDVEICRSDLLAGNGKDGASGLDAPLSPARAGRPGNPGVDACSKDSVPGALPVATVCGDVESIGGSGGDGYPSLGDGGYAGLPIPVPNPDGWGLGGSGATADAECRVGAQGKSGADGAIGESARGVGSVNESGWEGVQGGDGEDGAPGHGAGGGGGARGGVLYCGTGAKGGASGGSGGSGGCGGKGGQGGGYGGSSIGLVVAGAAINLHDARITTGNGGHGGAGGRAQFGGRGGIGGIGGAGVGGSKPGCDGGRGGTGGNGGYGAGGIGGHSIGVAYGGSHKPEISAAFSLGEPGHGGPAGNEADESGLGAKGIRAENWQF